MPHVSISGLQSQGALGQGISLYGWHGHNGFIGPRRGYNFRIYPMIGWNNGLSGAGLGETWQQRLVKYKDRCSSIGGSWSNIDSQCRKGGVRYNVTVDPPVPVHETSAPRGTVVTDLSRLKLADLQRMNTATARAEIDRRAAMGAPVSTVSVENQRAQQAGVPTIQTPLSASTRRFFESRGYQIQCRILSDRWFGSSAPPNNCRIGKDGKWTDWKFGAYALNLNPSTAITALQRQGVVQTSREGAGVTLPGGAVDVKPGAYTPDVVRLKDGQWFASDQIGADGKPLPGAVNLAPGASQGPQGGSTITSSPRHTALPINTSAPSSSGTVQHSAFPQEVRTQGYFPTDNAGRPLDSGFAPFQGGPAIFGGEVVAPGGGDGLSTFGGSVDVAGFQIPLWALIAGAGVAIYATKK